MLSRDLTPLSQLKGVGKDTTLKILISNKHLQEAAQ